MSIVEDFIAAQVVAVLLQEERDLGHVDGVVEGRGVADFALVGRHFALQTFDQMADRHARRNGVRIDDDVRGQSLARERHVFLYNVNKTIINSINYSFKFNNY